MTADNHASVNRVWRDRVNELLHKGMGIDEPCKTACTHFVDDDATLWTLLGVANTWARRASEIV